MSNNQKPAPYNLTPEMPINESEQVEIDYEGLGGNYPLHINMLAGSLAGITEHAVMFPVDVVRVRGLTTPLPNSCRKHTNTKPRLVCKY